jgi:hypothetical protein
MERASERTSERGAWGCAVDRARRNQMQPRVTFPCKDQWEVGELRQGNLLQAAPPPPPPPPLGGGGGGGEGFFWVFSLGILNYIYLIFLIIG